MKKNNYLIDFKELKKSGLKIWRKKKFNEFVSKYGKPRILDGYADILKDEFGNYMKDASTTQLIKVVEFDKEVGNYILKYLLDFEQRFNTVLIATILKEYNLNNNYVLTEDNCPWLSFKSFEEKNNFFNNIWQNVDSSNFLKKYEDKKNIPLLNVSMSWTFFNIIVFYESVDIDIQNKVIQGLGINNWNVDVFKSMIHIIRRLRNTISHNDLLISSKFEIYRTLIKKAKLDENKTFFYIYDVCMLLDIIYPTKNGICNQITKLLNKKKFKNNIKNKIINLVGINSDFKIEINKE